MIEVIIADLLSYKGQAMIKPENLKEKKQEEKTRWALSTRERGLSYYWQPGLFVVTILASNLLNLP